MKIGIEAQRLFDPQKHGSDFVALDLIHALQKIDRRNEYFIFARPDADRDCLAEAPNFHVVEIPGYNYLHWEQVQLPRYMRRFQIHVLHSTANTAPVRREVPLILNLHHINFMEDRRKTETRFQQLSNRYRRWIVPRVVDQAERVITVSEDEKQRILQKFPKVNSDCVQVVYNGVNEAFQTVVPERQQYVQTRYRLPQSYVLGLGSTDPKKNLTGLIEAFSQLAEAFSEVSLALLDTPESLLNAALGSHVRLRSRILALENVAHEDVPALYQLASVMVYPSLRESFSAPALEALAAGVPLVCSDLPSLREVVGSAARYIQPQAPDSIAQALTALLSDEKLRHQLVEDGKKAVHPFTWERTARQMIQIYESFK
ncbi:glycosyltransferase family 4 protein [Siphonobacter sp.]|uniref:glycosyltransferase family 4 protein n=1 Tax=Siphonobacter sp. TaxID=1869184 RepID=UPI003B3B31C8